MKQVIFNKKCDNVVHVKDTDSKYIYAGLNKNKEICIVTKSFDNNQFSIRIFDSSSSRNSNSGFTYGNGYTYENDTSTVEAVINEASHFITFYEFKTPLEFFEWAVTILK